MKIKTDSEERSRKLAAVNELARTCESEYEHVTHVSHLTLRLFDEMLNIHKMGDEERFLLQCASILHDIGWVEGWKNHHKVALRIIMETTMLPFNQRERLIIGSIARYHRKALPVLSHDHFASLNPGDRKQVQILSAFLRLADGLDKTHQGRITDVQCKTRKNRIEVICSSSFPAREEHIGGIEKADLLSLVFDREVIIRVDTG
jgi:exopolyphosphatase/pppGpp-phosphohydrolase